MAPYNATSTYFQGTTGRKLVYNDWSVTAADCTACNNAGWSTSNNAVTYRWIQNALDQCTYPNRNYVWGQTWTSGSASTSYQFDWCDDSTAAGYTWKTYQPKYHFDRNYLLKKAIRERYGPAIRTGKRPVGHPADIRERRARETLARIIGEDKYRVFLTSGFVSVRSPRSGLVYQIFPDHGITRVFQQGKLVERLCVVLKGEFPPTDSLIVRYLMILNNEQDFRSRAVKHSVNQAAPRAQQQHLTLPELARSYRTRLVG